jgi:hypothetical protein
LFFLRWRFLPANFVFSLAWLQTIQVYTVQNVLKHHLGAIQHRKCIFGLTAKWFCSYVRQIAKYRRRSMQSSKRLLSHINKTFGTLVFCRRWLEWEDGGSFAIHQNTGKQEKYMGALKNLCDVVSILYPYVAFVWFDTVSFCSISVLFFETTTTLGYHSSISTALCRSKILRSTQTATQLLS